ncbi:MAG: hypothetical protein H6Q42_4700 [Deltaproteobacteria bacterium]|jgi:hypothetical protein|nr:hypothetical protein [Deltaproteobacteria bacterium]
MARKKEMLTQEEATRQVLSIVNRMALLHYSYAKTLIRELGARKGKEVTRKAIDFYGRQVGKQVRERTKAKGLQTLLENYQEDLPLLGWNMEKVVVDGEPRVRIYDCNLAKAWNKLGAPGLGRLYCYMDQAKYTAYNPKLECVHAQNTLDGDPCCELAIRARKK